MRGLPFCVVVLAACAGTPEHHPNTIRVVHAFPRQQATEAAVGGPQEVLASLDRVRFLTGSYLLSPHSCAALGDAATALLAHPDLSLYIVGHVDDSNDEDYDWRLALRRANTVYSILIEKGVDARRMAVVSFGNQRPPLDHESSSFYAPTRHVDFRLMEGRVQYTLAWVDRGRSPLPGDTQ